MYLRSKSFQFWNVYSTSHLFPFSLLWSLEDYASFAPLLHLTFPFLGLFCTFLCILMGKSEWRNLSARSCDWFQLPPWRSCNRLYWSSGVWRIVWGLELENECFYDDSSMILWTLRQNSVQSRADKSLIVHLALIIQPSSVASRLVSFASLG